MDSLASRANHGVGLKYALVCAAALLCFEHGAVGAVDGDSPNPVAAPGSSTLTLVGGTTAPTGEYSIDVTGTSGSLSRSIALQLGLVTYTPDDIDWADEVRLAIEERASLSPDALTGMEASQRFSGPETMLTRVFGRLTAWQNWIFNRPNAVGEHGA